MHVVFTGLLLAAARSEIGTAGKGVLLAGLGIFGSAALAAMFVSDPTR